ncbi:uncharacterized protein LOC119987923 [Tripterygium wilfordii]|uniref:uncharacterized protein LOC119987923 n=1 Tax=Tripterygium wilfordii TaxID=458696 RepID=UPI0018F7EB78|nr:uncharacterized protein LOC119987923 [Tripterygium wilfordii]
MVHHDLERTYHGTLAVLRFFTCWPLVPDTSCSENSVIYFVACQKVASVWEENQIVDMQATLALMFDLDSKGEVQVIKIEKMETCAYCSNIEGEPDGKPWFHDIKKYLEKKRMILLRCVDVDEANRIMKEVHDGLCGTNANGYAMTRKIIRARYY